MNELFAILMILCLYPRTMIVREIDISNDIVICEDFTGNVWEWEGVEDWQVGDVAACVMDSKGTQEVSDDEIVMARYNGSLQRKGE